jgi:hypothetical protein
MGLCRNKICYLAVTSLSSNELLSLFFSRSRVFHFPNLDISRVWFRHRIFLCINEFNLISFCN